VPLWLGLAAASARAESTARFPEAPLTAPPPPSGAPAKDAARWTSLTGASVLVERATRLEAEGRLPEALAAYTEAIRLDGTDGAAILALARLRLRLNDVREGERLLTVATRFAEVAAAAHGERGLLREAQGRATEALLDLEQAFALATDDRVVAASLTNLYVQRRAWVAALAVQRLLLAETRDPALSQEAAVRIRALSLLAGPLDLVKTSTGDKAFTRRSLSRLAR